MKQNANWDLRPIWEHDKEDDEQRRLIGEATKLKSQDGRVIGVVERRNRPVTRKLE